MSEYQFPGRHQCAACNQPAWARVVGSDGIARWVCFGHGLLYMTGNDGPQPRRRLDHLARAALRLP
jgi:hypothetical protein